MTLVELESFAGLKRDYDIEMAPSESRRNVVTQGVPLNHLVGKEFQVGEVRLRGIKLCEPCGHLAKLTGKGVLPGLVHRGGLRAQILTDGTLRVGDSVVELDGAKVEEACPEREACEI